MATYFGINSDYDFFGNASGSSILSDYGLIRSGAYKKLMNAYYGKNKTTSDSSSSSSVEETDEQKQEKLNLKSVKTAAQDLKSAAESLKSGKVFEPVKNEETGAEEIDREAIKKQLTAFTDSYNKTIEAAGNTDTKSVLRKTVWMVNDVKASSKLLEDVGITIGEDNKLSIDEEKLGKARISTLKTLFSGYGSLAGKVMTKASELGSLSDAAMNQVTKSASSYTSKGDYTSLSTSSIYDSFF